MVEAYLNGDILVMVDGDDRLVECPSEFAQAIIRKYHPKFNMNDINTSFNVIFHEVAHLIASTENKS